MFRNRSQVGFPLVAACDHPTRQPLTDCQSAFPPQAYHYLHPHQEGNSWSLVHFSSILHHKIDEINIFVLPVSFNLQPFPL